MIRVMICSHFCVCLNVDLTVNVYHCINGDGDANENAENGSESFLCINVCVAIDTMWNLYSDTNADIKCEQALTRLSNSAD